MIRWLLFPSAFLLIEMFACNRVPEELPASPPAIAKESPVVARSHQPAVPSTSSESAARVVRYFENQNQNSGDSRDRNSGAQSGLQAAAKAAPTCPVDPAPRKLATVPLAVHGRNDVKLTAEFAHTNADSERGLMYRTEMGESEAMLFKLKPKVQNFWMHNTCISLDMLFLAADGTVVGFLEHVPTLNDEARTIGKVSSYVLETNAGYVAKKKLRVGDRFVLPAAVLVAEAASE
jgi:uncharacterized protein